MSWSRRRTASRDPLRNRAGSAKASALKGWCSDRAAVLTDGKQSAPQQFGSPSQSSTGIIPRSFLLTRRCWLPMLEILERSQHSQFRYAKAKAGEQCSPAFVSPCPGEVSPLTGIRRRHHVCEGTKRETSRSDRRVSCGGGRDRAGCVRGGVRDRHVSQPVGSASALAGLSSRRCGGLRFWPAAGSTKTTKGVCVCKDPVRTLLIRASAERIV